MPTAGESPSADGTYRRHVLIWTLLLAAVAALGKYKSSENGRDYAAQTAWREKIDRLEKEAQVEYQRLVDWLGELDSSPNARQQLSDKLNGGQPLNTQRDGDREVFDWKHPEYGIQLRLHFQGGRFAGHGLDYGTGDVMANHPQPVWSSRYSRAESWRQVVTAWMPNLWVIAMFVTLLLRRFRPLAAQAMLALALLCGTAWLVAPHYSLSVRGIFSNDPLFFAVVMLLVSIVSVAHVAAAEMDQRHVQLRLRFRLRTLLMLTALIAVCFAMGPFGYVALSVLAVGGAIFFVTLHVFSFARADRDRTVPGLRVS